MGFYEMFRELCPRLLDEKPIVAIVGGGGKTSALYALAGGLADCGLRVALTTTTHIRDPRIEDRRRFDEVIIDATMAVAGPLPKVPLDTGSRIASGAGGISVIASACLAEGSSPAQKGRLAGIHPSRAGLLLDSYDIVLVEADGSRGLPVKAPATYEPVIPADSSLVLGLIGLDCLGRAMDGETVHRPELFGPLVGCAPGEPIRAAHLRSLASSPKGLFKDSPERAIRLLVLNKADVADTSDLGAVLDVFAGLTPPGIDFVLVCSLLCGTSHIIGRGTHRSFDGGQR